jgi:hypothetical protein
MNEGRRQATSCPKRVPPTIGKFVPCARDHQFGRTTKQSSFLLLPFSSFLQNTKTPQLLPHSNHQFIHPFWERPFLAIFVNGRARLTVHLTIELNCCFPLSQGKQTARCWLKLCGIGIGKDAQIYFYY